MSITDIDETPSVDMLVCADCMMVISNGDETGIEDDRIAAVRKGVEYLGGYAYVVGDEGFTHYPCDCCHTKLAGDRFGVNYHAV